MLKGTDEASILLGHVLCLVYKCLHSVSSPMQCSYVQMQERKDYTHLLYIQARYWTVDRETDNYCTLNTHTYQGRIEPPKSARGHVTYIDGKMLSKFISVFTRAMTQAQLQTAEMADIPVSQRRRLSVPVGIEYLLDAEGILLL